MGRVRRWAVAGVCAAALVGMLAVSGRRIPLARTTDADWGIEALAGAHDENGDGIDDQAQILSGARAAVAARPAYDGSYVEGGWPPAGQGVCTDVTARALLAAGYDLQALIEQDMAAAPEAYGNPRPDPAIDFRRVANQHVWLQRHAAALTLDPVDIAQWRGGDIVVWDDHVGVVSDVRDQDGVPLVIHHAHPFQLSYEEDILRSWGAIVGHYRVAG